MQETILKYATLVLMVILLVVMGIGSYKVWKYEEKITALQNQLASTAVTLEVQKGLFEKLTLKVDDAKTLVDASTQQGKDLLDQVKREHATLLSVQNLTLTIKDKVFSGQGSQTTVDKGRIKVEFNKDDGLFNASGFTLTAPPDGSDTSHYEVKIKQREQLKLIATIDQDKDGAWKSKVSSSSPDISVDIGVAGVNPYLLEQKWYEKLKVHVDLGVGPGVLAGAGASYQVGAFDFGPTIWGTTSSGTSVFYGLNFSWSPFKKDK
jgi:hypothetical protein